LPERTFFTLDEISDRWKCPVDLINHYLDEELLRPAIASKSLPEDAIVFAFKEAAKRLKQEKIELSAERWRDLTTEITAEGCRDLMCEVSILPKDYPKYFYVHRGHFFEDGTETVTSTLENLEGTLYGLTSWKHFQDDRAAFLKPSLINVGLMYRWLNDPSTFEELGAIWDPRTALITREERDRFEREHNINVDSAADPTGYSTPHLEVLREAITHFFNPRHNPDPKREVVVEWIKDRLKQHGQDDSDRIATAIFTIIKQEDHDPRKRRG